MLPHSTVPGMMCHRTGVRKGGCEMGPHVPGILEGPTCGDSWHAKWQCATSYLMELLHTRVVQMERSGNHTMMIPEAVDYDGVATHILTTMNTMTRARYPENEWPADVTDNPHSHKTIRQPVVSLRMSEPWNVYRDLQTWMRALYINYASAADQASDEIPEMSDTIGWGNLLFTRFSPIHQTHFMKQLQRWCKAAVPYHEHAKYCPRPNATISELIQHIQTALQIFQPHTSSNQILVSNTPPSQPVLSSHPNEMLVPPHTDVYGMVQRPDKELQQQPAVVQQPDNVSPPALFGTHESSMTEQILVPSSPPDGSSSSAVPTHDPEHATSGVLTMEQSDAPNAQPPKAKRNRREWNLQSGRELRSHDENNDGQKKQKT